MKEVLKELVDNGEILPEIAATVRPDDITAFYRSPLGLRLLTASHSGRSRREQPFVMGLTAEEAGLSKEITDPDSDSGYYRRIFRGRRRPGSSGL